MTNIERINRHTEGLKRRLAILEKIKERMGEEKFNKIMDELSAKSWKK